MLARRTFSVRRLFAAIALFAFVVSNTEALIGQVRAGQVRSEESQAVVQHAAVPTTVIHSNSVGTRGNHQQHSPSHDHLGSNDHGAHEHGVGMTPAVDFGVGVAPFGRTDATALRDYRYLPDRSMKEPPRG